jgi:Altronate dehydratase
MTTIRPTAPATAVRIAPNDNVFVALQAFSAGEEVQGIRLRDPIPAGHKFALRDIADGEPIFKYGYRIGSASRPIPAGAHVHTHNLKSDLGEDLARLRFHETVRERPAPSAPRPDAAFLGYRRADGRAGIRNEIWVINTVGCVNRTAERLAVEAHRELAIPGSGIDGVYAFPHPFGCSQLGDDLHHTRNVLAGLVNHPNAAAVLIVGLGCENNQLATFLESCGGPDREQRIRFFNTQDVVDEHEAGLQALRELADYARQFKPEPISTSELVIGMKCGGSDGFSGVTGNPLVGRIADRLAEAGGTVLLSEVPEMFGAERVLLERTTDEKVFDGIIDLVNDFRGYFRRYNEPIDENPSPGNKAGGITTLAEKSLGCVQKGGRAPIRQVLAYGQSATPGLGGIALLNAPGNDGVSSTALTVAGAHMILFTTGRGTPMGFPVPTVKIATNSALAERKPQWIDFNAGALADGTASADDLADDLWQLILNIASTRQLARNEANGHREISIWKDGVTL